MLSRSHLLVVWVRQSGIRWRWGHDPLVDCSIRLWSGVVFPTHFYPITSGVFPQVSMIKKSLYLKGKNSEKLLLRCAPPPPHMVVGTITPTFSLLTITSLVSKLECCTSIQFVGNQIFFPKQTNILFKYDHEGTCFWHKTPFLILLGPVLGHY